MFLLDTNVLSERRKGVKADPGVREFLDRTSDELFLPVQVVGELLSGIHALRLRGDLPQARKLETWFQLTVDEYAEHILSFDLECARTWGVLMGVNDQHIVDRQIAAIALVYNLTVVTRNTDHFAGTGVRLLNPFRGGTVSSRPPAGRRSQ
jgi:predicted nucleic acid-binding protein